MKFTVQVTQEVEVTLDETKFTPEFMAAFRDCFYDFDSLEDHAEHLAQLEARGICGTNLDPFIEGYGRASEMGISMQVVDTDMDILEQES